MATRNVDPDPHLHISPAVADLPARRCHARIELASWPQQRQTVGDTSFNQDRESISGRA